VSIFTKQFVNADEYEQWLRGVGERISVLSITNSAAKRVYKPRQLWIRSPRMPSAEPLIPLGRQAGGSVTVKYQTSDRTLGPATSKNEKLVQIAIVAAIFFALFMFAVSKL